MSQVLELVEGYSTRKPETKRFRLMTLEEAKNISSGSTQYARDSMGKWKRVKINGQAKTWKTRPNDVRIPYKYGMYEYGYFEMFDGNWGDYPLLVEVN